MKTLIFELPPVFRVKWDSLASTRQWLDTLGDKTRSHNEIQTFEICPFINSSSGLLFYDFLFNILSVIGTIKNARIYYWQLNICKTLKIIVAN